jgi:hypothetical protein
MYNDTQHISRGLLCWVSQITILCSVSLCWVSLCWVSLCCVSLCWVSKLPKTCRLKRNHASKFSNKNQTDSDVTLNLLNLLKFLFHFFTIFDDGCAQPDEGDVVLEWIGGVVLRVEDDLVHLEIPKLQTGLDECIK